MTMAKRKFKDELSENISFKFKPEISFSVCPTSAMKSEFQFKVANENIDMSKKIIGFIFEFLGVKSYQELGKFKEIKEAEDNYRNALHKLIKTDRRGFSKLIVEKKLIPYLNEKNGNSLKKTDKKSNKNKQ